MPLRKLDEHLEQHPSNSEETLEHDDPSKSKSDKEEDSSSEDDYLTMSIPESETSSNKPSSSLQRARTLRLEAEKRAHQPSKQILEHERLKNLERGLHTPLDDPNKPSKGASMLQKLGYKGGPLGRAIPSSPSLSSTSTPRVRPSEDDHPSDANVNTHKTRTPSPIRIVVKNNKLGIGSLATETCAEKRAQTAFENDVSRAKRIKLDLGTYRDDRAQAGKEKRSEGVLNAAIRVGESLFEDETHKGGDKPVFLRVLELERRERDEEMKRQKERRERLFRSGSERDGEEILEEEDLDDRIARGEELDTFLEVRDDADDMFDEIDDGEMKEYLQSSVEQRLEMVILWMRKTHFYCFWCKSRYDNVEMDGCPGITEEDHE